MSEKDKLNEIENIVEEVIIKVYKEVNEELILMYQEIGKHLSKNTDNSKYGENFIDKFSKFLKKKFPDLKGFSRSGLYRMKQFYKLYKDDRKASTMLTQLSWSKHLLIMAHCRTKAERRFYMKLAVQNNLTYRELDTKIEDGFFELYKNDFESLNFEKVQDDKNLFLDEYLANFLNSIK